MRLIDADALIKDLCTVSAPTPSESWIVEKCIDKVNNAPTVDIKTEVAKEIFEEIEKLMLDGKIGNKYKAKVINTDEYAELKNKYTKEGVSE